MKHILLPKHPRNSSLPQLFQLRPHLSCLPPRQDCHILLHDRSGFQRAVTSPLLTRFGKGRTVQVLVCVLDASSRWLGGNEPSLPYPLSHQDIKLGRAPECTAGTTHRKFPSHCEMITGLDHVLLPQRAPGSLFYFWWGTWVSYYLPSITSGPGRRCWGRDGRLW